jgi:membrane-bound serine protease (ClpP class)
MKWSLFSLLLAAASLPVFSDVPPVMVLSLSGTVDPISARYLERGLDRAAREGAGLIVIELDTPGGLESSMNRIVEKILASPVPVAVYVSPRGARAASAGVFIAMAAHVAVMAPGTNIGAAHPVGARGAEIAGPMGEKVLNDMTAKLRALSEMRGRSPRWPDEAVRKSASLTDSEAVARRVVDMRANTLAALLSALDGRTVETAKERVVLRTADAALRRRGMTVVERFLALLVNPDIAYILLVIGIFGIIFELSAPGIGAPGIAGGIALLLALLSFGSLPTNFGGILFIALAVVLFIVDIKAPTHGLLTAGGIAAFLIGSFLLFPPWRAPSLPPTSRLRVSPVTIGVSTALVALFFSFVVSKGLRAQVRRVVFGAEALVGAKGTALTDIAPEGQVLSGGEQWSARSAGRVIRTGEEVEVVGRDGLHLLVRPRAHHQGGVP